MIPPTPQITSDLNFQKLNHNYQYILSLFLFLVFLVQRSALSNKRSMTQDWFLKVLIVISYLKMQESEDLRFSGCLSVCLSGFYSLVE